MHINQVLSSAGKLPQQLKGVHWLIFTLQLYIFPRLYFSEIGRWEQGVDSHNEEPIVVVCLNFEI